MINPEDKLKEMGLYLPEQLVMPEGMKISFPWVHRVENTLFISCHLAQNNDGTVAGPFGSVGAIVSSGDAKKSARQVGLTILGSIKREIWNLNKIHQWCRAFGMVNADPDFKDHPSIINGFTELILEVFGPNVGKHSRSAIGVSSLPLNVCVEIEAQVLIKS